MEFIGPIPSVIFPADVYARTPDCFWHPGGPAPKWGGYRPVRGDMAWHEFCDRAESQRTLTDFGARWRPHSSESTTELVYGPEGWLVSRPDPDRVCQRAVTIARDAVRELVAHLLGIGIRQEEIDAALAPEPSAPAKYEMPAGAPDDALSVMVRSPRRALEG